MIAVTIQLHELAKNSPILRILAKRLAKFDTIKFSQDVKSILNLRLYESYYNQINHKRGTVVFCQYFTI